MEATDASHNELEIRNVFALQKAQSQWQRTEPISERKNRLKSLRSWIHKNRTRIHNALRDDFGKNPQEVDAIEIFHVLNEIKLALQKIDEWTQPKKVDAPITMLGTRSFIQYEPKGVCLIISPWNYPFSLAIGPLVSALAAGNTAIIKPSEMTPNTSALLRDLAKEIFPENSVAVFEGGPEVSQALLQLPFDHIFFTGSPAVGKIVMKAAAENLSSVTLELGGKSPAFVTRGAPIKVAAQRIAVAKFVNNGQTCVAPDYVLIDKANEERFVSELIRATKEMFSVNGSFAESASYCRIVNQKHFSRITALVDDAVEKGATMAWTGPSDSASRLFHPTILTKVSAKARILEEEIFGPVIPVITYDRLEEAIAMVNSRHKPLALYVFAGKSSEEQAILSQTSAGGVCINDCGVHFLHHNLPFGGTNHSGFGKSHGHYGFLAFSNEKGVLRQRKGWTTFQPFYPPYTETSKRLMDWFLKLF